jgi:mannose-6-phosphate isomerase-like protein (cupin superfamily)
VNKKGGLTQKVALHCFSDTIPHMKRILLPLAISALALSLSAAEPTSEVWTAAKLKSYEKGLADKSLKGPLGNWGNHSALMIHRDADGEVEVHDTQTDILFVISGEATVVVGGKGVDMKQTAPGEWRGPSSTGGEVKKIGPGDVMHIPAGEPHWFKVAKGGQITYLAFKVSK